MVLSLVAAACSSGDDESGQEIEDRADEATLGESNEGPGGEEDDESGGLGDDEDAPAAPRIHPALSELSGQLAIVDGGDVTVANPDGTGGAIVDGQSVREVVASQPIWSVDGARLAWATIDPGEVTVSVLGGEEPDEIVVASDDGNPIFYMQWAPDGTKLAYLRNAPEPGVEAGVATVGDGLEPFAEGQPFYVSWAADSERVLAHVGGTLGGTQGQVFVFEPPSTGAEPDAVLRPTITFTAPAWLDETTIVGAADGGLLSIDLETGASELLVETSGPIQFVASPDGTKIAYRAAGTPGSPDADLPPLYVLDVETGDETIALQRNALAWEWSPGSDRLAILGPETASGFEQISFDARQASSEASTQTSSQQPVQQASAFRWFFWDEQIFSATPAHLPSQLEVSSYLPFFEQYAQSHHRWSGDGLGFAFAGTIGGESGIWVQVAEDERTSSLVARGEHVTWSPLSGAIGGGRSIQ